MNAKRKYYTYPVTIERETEKAYLFEGLGWFPKSQVILGEEPQEYYESQYASIPAWLAQKAQIVPPSYMLHKTNIIVEYL